MLRSYRQGPESESFPLTVMTSNWMESDTAACFYDYSGHLGFQLGSGPAKLFHFKNTQNFPGEL